MTQYKNNQMIVHIFTGKYCYLNSCLDPSSPENLTLSTPARQHANGSNSSGPWAHFLSVSCIEDVLARSVRVDGDSLIHGDDRYRWAPAWAHSLWELWELCGSRLPQFSA